MSAVSDADRMAMLEDENRVLSDEVVRLQRIVTDLTRDLAATRTALELVDLLRNRERGMS
jgi:hypothetical protein